MKYVQYYQKYLNLCKFNPIPNPSLKLRPWFKVQTNVKQG